MTRWHLTLSFACKLHPYIFSSLLSLRFLHCVHIIIEVWIDLYIIFQWYLGLAASGRTPPSPRISQLTKYTDHRPAHISRPFPTLSRTCLERWTTEVAKSISFTISVPTSHRCATLFTNSYPVFSRVPSMSRKAHSRISCSQIVCSWKLVLVWPTRIWYANLSRHNEVSFRTPSLVSLSTNFSKVFRINDNKLIGLKDLSWVYFTPRYRHEYHLHFQPA